MATNLSKRFNEFQSDAVNSIVDDFQKTPAGRYLLVIPTGGGKTITAVKSVNALFGRGVFDKDEDSILWVAHRDYLLQQAESSFKKFEEWYPDEPSFANKINFCMNVRAADAIRDDDSIRLVVIDEAHHAAANTYLPLFKKPTVGILGLTATPTRHDGKPLEFERESYSKGFPDLVDAGVVLKPKIRVIDTDQEFDIAGFGEEDLKRLDTTKRNQIIIDELVKNQLDYKKVVVYVGSVAHAENLQQQMLGSKLADYYDSISFITGKGNSRGVTRDDFLAAEKNTDRSVIVNVDVLTEGYDDPSVNTIVMARPTNSKLIYMQAMGRAIRHEPNNDTKTAFIVEVVDKLPNIRYRIDNRWLYAEISDALEPSVEDHEFSSLKELEKTLQKIYDDFRVPTELRPKVALEQKNRYGLMLFKVFLGPGNFKHLPILMSNENRIIVSRFFNYLSERIPYFVRNRINTGAIMRMIDISEISLFDDPKNQARVVEAMENSSPDDSEGRSTLIEDMSPWITYFAFHHRKSKLNHEILDFLDGVVNAEQLREIISTSSYPTGSYLVRFPLPLHGFLGRILHESEFLEVSQIITELQSIRNSNLNSDHRMEVTELIQNKLLPIEPSLASSLSTIVRDELLFSMKLD